jgi:peptide deformylase
VVVHAQDVVGTPIELEAEGLIARIVQHEIDHLDGRLILDRATPEERRRVLKELRERSLELDQ